MVNLVIHKKFKLYCALKALMIPTSIGYNLLFVLGGIDNDGGDTQLIYQKLIDHRVKN
jgi:hypothetical protein